jgi:hypothetical protein
VGSAPTAEALGVGKSSVMDWLNGKRGVPEPLIAKLVAASAAAA